MENKLVPKEGYQIRTVTITNFHRSMAPADIAHNLGTLVNMQRSKKQAKAILDEFKPATFLPPSTSPTPSPA